MTDQQLLITALMTGFTLGGLVAAITHALPTWQRRT